MPSCAVSPAPGTDPNNAVVCGITSAGHGPEQCRRVPYHQHRMIVADDSRPESLREAHNR